MRRYRKFLVLLVLVLVPAGIFAQLSSREAFKLAVVMEKVSRYYVDSINETEVVEDAIEHLLHELDPHSSYLSKEELEEVSEQLEGEFEGIGVSFNVLDDTIYIIRTISGGPSEKVGIRAGDRIVRVEGETVAGTGITTREVQQLLKGPKGTRVDVSVARRGTRDLLDFTITRDKIPVNSLDAAYMVDDRIGYIKLARFSHTTIGEFESAMEELLDRGMDNLVLDLSGNGGGWLPVAVDLADHFLSGTREIVSTRGEKVPDRKYSARKTGMFEQGQLVIMIDENSASASEIVSGAVQDWDRGVIVGRRSFGKGLVQQPFPLGDGSMIRLTVSRYYTPTGRLIQKPYEDGYEEYSLDLINRYNRGELNNADSILFPESQRYRTLELKRTVYGGGGIMPDIFVPIDTSFLSDYYRGLISRGLLNSYMLQYVDQHRNELEKHWPVFKDFRDNYKPGRKELEELQEYAANEGLEFDELQWAVSDEQISLLFKAYMARDLYGMASFSEIYNSHDEVFLKAVEILDDPDPLSKKLARMAQIK